MKTFATIAIASLVGIAITAHAGTPSDVVSTSADRTSTSVTVYNDNLALVKEKRQLTLPAGVVRLSLREVSAQLQAETALLRAVSGKPITLIEQNFDFDLLTPGKLLDKYIGREVTVIRTNQATGAETREKATVLAAGEGTVLRFADRIETGVPGRLAFDSVPANLRDRPTLSVLFEGAGGQQSLELSYLTGGLSWRADYVAELAADGKSLDLSGWVTLTNGSGTSYENAKLQLVAGKINRVRQGYSQMAMAAPAPMAMRAKSIAPQEEGLMDYHLYTFDRPTTLAENQTKQLALLSASGVPATREYLLTGTDHYYRGPYENIGEKLKPAVFLIFDNKGPLGKPLPAGTVRAYARDSKGAAQFVGEDRIQHTAKNEVVRLRLGEAFDITADRKQTKFKMISDKVYEASYRLVIRNAKSEAAVVRVQEPIPGDWEMVQESHKHTQISSRAAQWDISIPTEGSTTLEYTTRMKW
jgi:hypothetical protein